MRQNHDSIYGCSIAGMDKPDYGRITRNGNILYYHIMESQVGVVPLIGLRKEQVKRMWLVSNGSEIKVSDSWVTHNYQNIVFISFGDSPILPDPIDTVVAVELAE